MEQDTSRLLTTVQVMCLQHFFLESQSTSIQCRVCTIVHTYVIKNEKVKIEKTVLRRSRGGKHADNSMGWKGALITGE